MNRIERYKAVLQSKRPDKIPVRVANYNMFAHHYYGLSIADYISNPERHAEVFCNFAKEFGFDCVRPASGYILYGCGPELGTVWQFPEEEFPASTEGIFETRDDVENFRLPDQPEGYFKNFLEINRLVNEEIGEDFYLSTYALGPFSVLGFLRGLEKLLLDTALDPGFFKVMMEKAEEVSLFIGRHCQKLGFSGLTLLEIFIVPGLIRPEVYDEQIAPHIDNVCSQLTDPPMANSMGVFMGKPGQDARVKQGKFLFDYFFGTQESIDLIREASKTMVPGFPRLVALSGNALVHWPADRILDFLEQGLDHFVLERGEYPVVFLASVQPPDRESALDVAHKLKTVMGFLDQYSL